MRVALISFVGLIFCFAANADSTAEIEFQQRMQALGNSISTDKSQESEYCKELARKIQSTFGPQRNYVAKEEYRRECMRQEQLPTGSTPAFDR
jgi:hypothetical protein